MIFGRTGPRALPASPPETRQTSGPPVGTSTAAWLWIYNRIIADVAMAIGGVFATPAYRLDLSAHGRGELADVHVKVIGLGVLRRVHVRRVMLRRSSVIAARRLAARVVVAEGAVGRADVDELGNVGDAARVLGHLEVDVAVEAPGGVPRVAHNPTDDADSDARCPDVELSCDETGRICRTTSETFCSTRDCRMTPRSGVGFGGFLRALAVLTSRASRCPAARRCTRRGGRSGQGSQSSTRRRRSPS